MQGKSRRFPAEWEKQQAILLCFPYNGNDWPGKFGAIQWVFVEYIKKIASFQDAYVIVKDRQHQTKVQELLETAHVQMDHVYFLQGKTNRSWMRDAGPIIVKTPDGSPEAIQFSFNGWAKYSNYRLDRQVPKMVAEYMNIPLTQAMHKDRPVVLEGGAIDVNGSGCMLTTEECLLDKEVQERNTGFTREDYEKVFEKYLGVDHVVWLGKGINGDDTHGHIDDLARFVNEDTVVTVTEKNKRDDNYQVLFNNLKRLKSARLSTGKQINIVELPMPGRLDFDGIRIPASYANFLIINGAVLMPFFNDPMDRIAANILAECFKDREIIGISCIDLIWGFGTLHCLSQQIPTNEL